MAPLVRFLFFLLLSLPACAGVEEAIVGLYVTLDAGRSDLGTGFFTSADGQIVTAYHVINGARKIKAVSAGGQMFDDLRIDFVSPQRDLAVLQIIGNPKTPNFLAFARRIPDPAEPLTVIGYPRGLPTQVIAARSTSGKLLSSFSLRNEKGQRLFRQDIEILPLDATIYSGMSGAPVLSENEVLGILSGSLAEGGTIAWMIPTLHLDTLVRLVKRPQDVSTWPAFDLMAGGFRSLSRSYRVDSQAERLLETFIDEVERYAEAGTQIGTGAAMLLAQIAVTRPMFQMFLTDPELSRNAETAEDYLEYPFNAFVTALGPYGEAHTNFGHASQAMANSAFDLLHWAESIAASDPVVSKHLQVADQRIRSSGVTGRYYQTIGSNPDRLGPALARFGATVSKLETGFSTASGRQAVTGILAFQNDIEPEVAIHASPHAMLEMRRLVATYRGIAKDFEPIVYRQ